MDLSIVSESSRRLGRTLTRHSPTILTGLGVAGLLSSIALAVKGTIKAVEIVDRECEFRLNQWENQTGEHRDSYPLDRILEPVEIVELTWKEYIPTAVMTATTIACMIGSNSIHLRRNAAMVSLFSITETALKEYQAKVVEKIGENKEEKIRGEIAQEKVDANPFDGKAVVLTHHGSMLCYDALSGRYFYSDIETIRKAQNDFNERLLSEMSIPLNEFYADLGLDPIDMGAQTGWDIEKGKMNLYLGGAKISKDGQPCIVVEHRNLPVNIWS